MKRSRLNTLRQKKRRRAAMHQGESLEHRYLLTASVELDKSFTELNGSSALHANIQAGDELTYTFEITNTGDEKLTNVQLNDGLPGFQLDGTSGGSLVVENQSQRIPPDGRLGPFSSIDRELASDPFEAKAWDNFTLSDATTISRLGWTGAYIEPFAYGPSAFIPSTDFIIEFYADDAGKPGALLASQVLDGGDTAASDAEVATALVTTHTAENGGPVYNYNSRLDAVDLPAGDYWLSITASQVFPSRAPHIDPTWQWHLGNNGGGDGFYYYDDTFDDPGDNENGLVDTNPWPANYDPKDLAFTLYSPSDSFTGGLLPGESVTFTGTYTVTPADVAAGEVVNTAIVSADGTTGMTSASDSVTVPIAEQADIELDKHLWDVNESEQYGDIYVGDKLIYGFFVSNTGNTPLTNVQVDDPLPGIWMDGDVLRSYDVVEQPAWIPTGPAGDTLGPYASVDRLLGSDPYEAKAWDNFSLTDATLVDGISWTGAYVEPFATGPGSAVPRTDFRVELYADNAGRPGTQVADFTLDGGNAGVSDADVWTTPLAHQAENGGPVFEYDARLPFTQLAAGDYWVSITAMQTFPSINPVVDPTWQWHVAEAPGDGFLYYDDTFDDPGDLGNGLVDGTPDAATATLQADKDLAFSISEARLEGYDPNKPLMPGESMVFIGYYTVTPEDGVAGEVHNTATATGTSGTGTTVSHTDGEWVPVTQRDSSLELDKHLWDVNDSSDYQGIFSGDKLIYGFFVTNTGDTDLTNVEIDDPLDGLWMDGDVFRSFDVFTQNALVPTPTPTIGPFASVDRELGSDPYETKAWDNFSLSGDTILDGVSWDGAYVEPFATGPGSATAMTDFKIEIYADASGQPGQLLKEAVLDGGVAGDSDTQVRTTPTNRTAEDGGPVYHYSSRLPLTHLGAGDYWISITALQTFPSTDPVIDPTWQWHVSSTNGDGFLYYDDNFDDPGDSGQGLVDGVPHPANANRQDGKDLAFQLTEAKLVGYDPNDPLEPGETMIFVGYYDVTDTDAAAGVVNNHATATGQGPDGPVTDSDTESVPISQRVPSVDINKYLWDINGSPVLHPNIQPGDELIYSFDVTNTGNTTLTNVQVTDSLPGAVMDPQVVTPFIAFDQPRVLPPSGNDLGPFASVDRTLASDPLEGKAWDNFTLSEDTVIDGISWDGAYVEPFAAGLTPETDFTVELYANNGGAPGNLLHTFPLPGGQAGVDDALVKTTPLPHTAPAGGPAFHYKAMLPFTLVPAGEYWISITAQQTFPNPSPTVDPTWQWHVGKNAAGADGFYHFDDTFDDPGDNGQGDVDSQPRPTGFETQKDLAFTLHGARQHDFDGTLEPGEVVMFMATYIVTAADVAAGQVVNEGTVTAQGAGQTVTDSDTETVGINVPMTLDKYLWDINGLPTLHSDVKVGDELIYSFDVTNTSTTPITNVSVTDPLPGLVMDAQVARAYVAYDQPAKDLPTGNIIGPFSSLDRTLSSDPEEARAWDNFSVSSNTVIDAIGWTGGYVEPLPGGSVRPQTDFLVELYKDDGGKPGTTLISFPLLGGEAGVNDANVKTTLLADTTENGGPTYRYHGMLPFTELLPGDYWVSITALQTFPNASPTIDPTWQWHVGEGSGDGFYTYDDTFDDVGDGQPTPTTRETGKDLAFTLHAARLEDFDGVVDPGETVMFMGTYIVTQADIDAGQIVNQATANGTLSGGATMTVQDSFTFTINQYPGLDLTANQIGSASKFDQTTDMEFFVENDGNVTLVDVSIVSPGNAAPTLDASSDNGDGVLSPGETWRFVGLGTNSATATATGVTAQSKTATDQTTLVVTPESCTISYGDVNGDGQVGFADFLLVSDNFGATGATRAMGDLDCDGIVGFSDFLLVSDNFGKAVPAAEEADAVFAADDWN